MVEQSEHTCVATGDPRIQGETDDAGGDDWIATVLKKVDGDPGRPHMNVLVFVKWDLHLGWQEARMGRLREEQRMLGKLQMKSVSGKLSLYFPTLFFCLDIWCRTYLLQSSFVVSIFFSFSFTSFCIIAL